MTPASLLLRLAVTLAVIIPAEIVLNVLSGGPRYRVVEHPGEPGYFLEKIDQ